MYNKAISKIYTILFFSLIIFFGLAFAACAKKDAPEIINISYVESPFNLQLMVMKEKGTLEEAFAARNIKVAWHEINSGADQTQAMAAGSLDIASVINSTSVILANAAGNSVKICGIVSRPRKTFALLTGPEGPANVQELKGKTIAGPKGTVLHQMLVAALASEGLSAGDVSFIQMGLPEARTALLSGQVDGALQAASLIIRGEEAGMKILFTADGYLSPLLLSAVRPEFAEKNPELLEVYTKAQKETYDWILDNTEEAVAIGSRYQGISEADGLKLYEWSGMAVYMNEGDIEALKADVDFLFSEAMIEQKINPRDIFLGGVRSK